MPAKTKIRSLVAISKSSVTLSNAYSPKSTLEQRSAKRLLQKSFSFENQRPRDHFLKIPEFAYTFAYTPTLTTRRPPVYMALSWVSVLITREPRLDLKLTKSRLESGMVRFSQLSVTLSNACEI